MSRRSIAAAAAEQIPSLPDNPLLALYPTLAEMHEICGRARARGSFEVASYMQEHITRMEREEQERRRFPLAERAAEFLRRLRQGTNDPL